MEGGVISASTGQTLSILLMLIGVIWAVKGADKLRRLSELYLWLAFILSIYHLHVLAQAVAGWMGLDGIVVFRPVAIVHLLVVGAALWALGAWSSDEEPAATGAQPARLAAGLFVVGAVVFWVGARTFPGMALEKIQANPAGHLWTSVNFLLANVITLAGLALFTLALREAGDRYFSILGLLFFTFGAVFWTLHLAFRLTVMVRAAQELNLSSGPPQWFEPWRDWAALLFGIYSVLAYVGLAAYGGALLKTGWLPRWVGWTCVVAGLLAAPLGGLPLFIHVPLWLAGILTLKQRWTGPDASCPEFGRNSIKQRKGDNS
ncbi:MAG: hypothetical protein ACREEM_12750 [Blastocatellia bacterium]